jgi:hypothetical protein
MSGTPFLLAPLRTTSKRLQAAMRPRHAMDRSPAMSVHPALLFPGARSHSRCPLIHRVAVRPAHKPAPTTPPAAGDEPTRSSSQPAPPTKPLEDTYRRTPAIEHLELGSHRAEPRRSCPKMRLFSAPVLSLFLPDAIHHFLRDDMVSSRGWHKLLAILRIAGRQ